MSRLNQSQRGAQAGFMLLEVLVAILIFAIGVLSLVGLQVASVKDSSQSRYRSDATLLANELVGRMWVTDRSFTTIDAEYSSASAGAAYSAWLTKVEATLPGASTNPPTVAVASVPAGAAGGNPSSLVTMQVFWKAPNEPVADPVHSITLVTQIK
jgi:type IV pilus assembly protein PilV